MPIYENKYREWKGTPKPLIHRLLAFPRFSYMQLKGKKIVNTVFVMAWLPFVLFTAYIYARVNVKLMESLRIPVNQLWKVNEGFFFVFCIVQFPFLVFFTVMVGPQLISRDIRHKALPMILSKPISRFEYLIGKFLILFLLLSTISWFQGIILFISQTAAVSSTSEWRMLFWKENLWILPKIVIFSLLVITTLNLLVMFFSSLTKNYRFAGVAMIMFIIGGIIIPGIASGIFRNRDWMILSTFYSITSIGLELFSIKEKVPVSPFWALIHIATLWGIALAFLAKKTRAFQLYRE